MSRTARPLFVPVLMLLAATILLAATGLLDRIDNRLGDALLAAEAGSRPPPDDIVFVTIDQKSLEAMQETAGSWPWPRAIHGELIENLEAFHPRAIAFDILFNEADSFRADSDAFLRQVTPRFDNLFFPSLLLADGHPAPLNALPARFGARKTAGARADGAAPLLVPLILDPSSWQGGLINFEHDDDGTGRHARLHATVDGWELPTMSAAIARFSGAALPAGDRIRLHWYRELPRQISYSDLFEDLSREKPRLAPTLRDRIIIIAATAPGLHDLRPTPLAQLTPGAEILTTAIANLRHEDWLQDMPVRWPLTALLVGMLTLAFGRRVSLVVSGAGLATLSALLLAGDWLLLGMRWYAPLGAALTLAWLAWVLMSAEAWWQERREREATVSLFRRFLDPRVVDDLVQSGELVHGQKPQAREITILFSDIRGFTTLSETRTPEAVVELLNRYFSQQVEVVFRHGGTLDKFIGDAIMAFWNAPADNPLHAAHAVQAALGMAEALDRFRKELAATDGSLADFDIGIGLHTGPAVVGFLGSDDRLDYTAIGDTVNLGSRIEGCTKGVARVLVSRATRDACERQAPGRFQWVDHGDFHVKGRDQGVQLFEPQQQPEIRG
ncbi:MAG TPA: adenylate/guanylate cyclase domain-containing protein [Moraxellaceae bacterium]|nr:adenylate/guanylate cyclase domain-containing protein [Moraxellaceae bacterium]